MSEMVNTNLFEGYVVGTTHSMVVSHLQFADDTLLGVKSWANVRALQAMLLLFEDNISELWLVEAASILNSKKGKFPFVYLGLSIGGNP